MESDHRDHYNDPIQDLRIKGAFQTLRCCFISMTRQNLLHVLRRHSKFWPALETQQHNPLHFKGRSISHRRRLCIFSASSYSYIPSHLHTSAIIPGFGLCATTTLKKPSKTHSSWLSLVLILVPSTQVCRLLLVRKTKLTYTAVIGVARSKSSSRQTILNTCEASIVLTDYVFKTEVSM